MALRVRNRASVRLAGPRVIRRRRGSLRLGLTAGALLLAMLAAPAGPGRGEGEAGRFSIHPSIRVTAVGDDNLFLQGDDRDTSIGAWLFPRVELGYRNPHLELGADLGVELHRYATHFSSRGDELYHLSGFGEVGLLPGLSLQVSDAFVPRAVRLGLPADEALNQVQTNRAEAQLRYWMELPHARELQFGVGGTRFDSSRYSEAIPVAGGSALDDEFRADFWGAQAFAEFQTPVGRRSSSFLRAEGGRRSFDDTPRSDLTDFLVLLGVRSEPWRDVEIELVGGGGLIVFDSLRDVRRVVGRGSLQQNLENGWSWGLSVSHLASADLVGNLVRESTGRVDLEKFFGRRTAASLGLFLTRFDNEAWTGGADLFGAAEARVRYQISRFSQAALTYRHWWNGGGHSLDDFRQNRIAIEYIFRR